MGRIDEAIKNGDLDYLKKAYFSESIEFLSLSTDGDYENCYLYFGLRDACEYGQLKIVKFLIKIGAEVFYYDNPAPFKFAIKNNYKEIVDFLVSEKPELLVSGDWCQKDLDLFEKLLKWGYVLKNQVTKTKEYRKLKSLHSNLFLFFFK